MTNTTRGDLGRRTFLRIGAAGLSVGMLGCGDRGNRRPTDAAVPQIDAGTPPTIPYGVQSGDVTATSAVIWAATDRRARMRVTWATDDQLSNPIQTIGPEVGVATAYAGKLLLNNLPAGQDIYYEVEFINATDESLHSQPVRGRLRTAPTGARDIRFLWSGDVAGQGWGINLEWGGMKIFETMLALDPDFFIHSGDYIYADGPLAEEVKLPDGTIWNNDFVTPELTKVAETLDEFRAHYKYNLLDEHFRAFVANVPQIVQWDDHETTNNWYPGEILDDPRYTVTEVDVLAERARTAFLEWTPIATLPDEPERLFRSFEYGPLLDLFMLDLRTYRNANGPNNEPEGGAFLGAQQLDWLEQGLLASTATWKVIGSDMPIGLIVGDGDNFENGANGDGPALGRELDIARVLRFIRDQDIKNVVWLTADVHYTAAHYYDPSQAQFTEFKPFYEFVSGPLNAGTFGPNPLDNTFGPQVLYQKAPEPDQINAPPSAGLQFFGEIVIASATQVMTVNLRDLAGDILFTQEISPEP